jgi:hypothetical protein
MAKCVVTIKATMLRDMINVWTSPDNLIRSFGEKVAKITKAGPDTGKRIFAKPVLRKKGATAKPPPPSLTQTFAIRPADPMSGCRYVGRVKPY